MKIFISWMFYFVVGSGESSIMIIIIAISASSYSTSSPSSSSSSFIYHVMTVSLTITITTTVDWIIIILVIIICTSVINIVFVIVVIVVVADVVVNVISLAAIRSLQWPAGPADGDTVFTCVGQDVTLPFTFNLSAGEEITSMEWLFKGIAWRLFVGCLTSQQHASVSQGRICKDNFTCCHTGIEIADQTFYLTQSQYTDTGPTSPSADPITPSAWQGSNWSANFEVAGMTRPRTWIQTPDLPLSRRTP